MLPSPSHRPSLSCKCGIRLRFGAFCREKRLKGCPQAPLELMGGMGGMGGFLKSVGRLPFENVAANLLFSCFLCLQEKSQPPVPASDFDQPRCPPLPRPGPRRAPLAIIKDGRVLKSGGKIRARRGSRSAADASPFTPMAGFGRLRRLLSESCARSCGRAIGYAACGPGGHNNNNNTRKKKFV